jgi:hypothetical protein
MLGKDRVDVEVEVELPRDPNVSRKTITGHTAGVVRSGSVNGWGSGFLR